MYIMFKIRFFKEMTEDQALVAHVMNNRIF